MSENKCPHPKCKKMKPFDHYACYYHWRGLPSLIKIRILGAFKKHGALSPEWMKAHEDAVAYWGSL